MVLIADIRTRLHACSIEAFKNDVYFCGTYELNEETRERKGEIVAFRNELAVHTTVCESGVLDMKIVDDKLASVLSTGKLELYKIESNVAEQSNLSLTLEATAFDESEGLFLSVDIDNRCTTNKWNSTTRLVVSTQQGSILVFEYIAATPKNTLQEIFRVTSAHNMMRENMPAWIVFFDPHSKTRFISGGDDLCLNVWTLPASEASGSGATEDDVDEPDSRITKVATNRKTHSAGVTSGQWHPLLLNLFATGSYDEHVRLWDVRDISKPILDIHTGGGLWRVKWVVPEGASASETSDPQEHFLVVAGMHGGCHVYRLRITIEDDKMRVETVNAAHHTDERNENHLAYGIDVISFVEKDSTTAEFTLASCSFYDNLIQMWSCVV